MYDYIIGKITNINFNSVTIENNGIGYKLFVSNPFSFREKEETKVYLYEHVREDEHSLYGFKEEEERELFLKLIDVKGLGCKMALPMLYDNDISSIVNAIEEENINYLKKFPKIGDKVARQIILDLKGKLVETKETKKDNDLIDALKSLGYKSADINKVIKEIDPNKTIEEKIKEALRLLLK